MPRLGRCLDVVYNHLGPEGNYFNEYGPYFTDKYQTPWGKAINYDAADSDPVRHFFIQNAMHWLENYHLDVLRLDAVHGIFDFGATHFLAELQQAVKALGERLGRKLHLIAESDLNDSRLLGRRRRVGTIWLRNGAMIFIIPCIPSSPENAPDIIPTLAMCIPWRSRCEMAGFMPDSIRISGGGNMAILPPDWHDPVLWCASRITIKSAIAPGASG